MELTYTQQGDYLIPDLTIEEQPEMSLGKYGRMRKHYLKQSDVALGVGLPITLFGPQRERFRKYFMRDNVQFSYGGRGYTVNIKECQVFPQGFAALCRYYNTLSIHASLTLLDIGGFTVDIMRCRNGRADKTSSVSTKAKQTL